ncbi:hypothetical protein FRB90_011049 [Tulasnella sp. 427]|nr:hypothetical protein FRB90_011049 [Tulasnella sp. 427]
MGRRRVAAVTAGRRLKHIDDEVSSENEGNSFKIPESTVPTTFEKKRRQQAPASVSQTRRTSVKRVRLRVNYTEEPPHGDIHRPTEGVKTIPPTSLSQAKRSDLERTNRPAGSNSPPQALEEKRRRGSRSVSVATRPLPKRIKLKINLQAEQVRDHIRRPSKGEKALPSFYPTRDTLRNADRESPAARLRSTSIALADHQAHSSTHSLAGESFLVENPSQGNPSLNQSRDEGSFNSSPEPDPHARHVKVWIPFGMLKSTTNPKIAYVLEILNDRTGNGIVSIGSNRANRYHIFGPGVAEFHSVLTLKHYSDQVGRIHREIWVHNYGAVVSPENPTTSIWVGGTGYAVGEQQLPIPPGARIQFGNGDIYEYEAPKCLSLYSPSTAEPLYNKNKNEDLNSSVFRVTRNCDQEAFVAKTISSRHQTMAATEITAFQLLGRHPSIVRFIEAFYDPESKEHHLILESGTTDLRRYTIRERPLAQDFLRQNAGRWIGQITEAIKHMHDLDMTHRDLKPHNILVFISTSGQVDMKVTDMGLARRSTGPITRPWFAGTEKWAAPVSFMSHPDDKPVDAYGVGRLLFFLLTDFQWPEEPRKGTCPCREPCKGPCVAKQAGFRAIKNAPGVSKECFDFLKGLLVDFPWQCMTVEDMLEHPFLVKADIGDASNRETSSELLETSS